MIAWYVDDNKISHENLAVVSIIIEKIEERFGKMTATRGKEHEFLGMHIRYVGKQRAVVTIKSYLAEAIEECEMDIKRTTTTPAKRNLFEVDPKAKPLTKESAETFHKVVAKFFYVAIRARPDILLPVGYLCTRVSASTEQVRAKLKRVLEYINGTMEMEYTVSADSLTKIRAWMDASYAVHPDMRSHTGGIMPLGTGGFVPKSNKQKLNTKSSTEAELVGASDYLPNLLWAKMFVEAQGYVMGGGILEQDNESAIKLEKNEKASTGPKYRHITSDIFGSRTARRRTGYRSSIARH